MTAKLRPYEAGRYVDPDRGLCALRLAGWSPLDLLEHDGEETAREEAEGVRLAYVAATRARDLLVVPVVGDEAWDGGWLDPLNAAVYPALDRRRVQAQAPGCPPFRSKDSVIDRPNGDPASAQTVCPGAHEFDQLPPGSQAQPQAPDDDSMPRTSPGAYAVVWWDPHLLSLDAAVPFGIRRDDLIVKDVPTAVIASSLARYQEWRHSRDEALQAGSRLSIQVRTVTEAVAPASVGQTSNPDLPPSGSVVEIVDLAPDRERPAGPRFGSLVHAVLAAVPLNADDLAVQEIARLQGRILSAPGEEIAAAVSAVEAALRHPFFEPARVAAARGACRREVPVAFVDADRSLVEGIVDLAYQDDTGWIVCDFKTDRELEGSEETYRRQVAAYARFVATATHEPARGVS